VQNYIPLLSPARCSLPNGYATTTIEASNQIIQPASVIYQAGQKITLKEGFKVNMGATFKTIIADCTF